MPIFTDAIPQVDTAYARDISFPRQFNQDCDMLLDQDQEIIDQSLMLISFIQQGDIRLFTSMGSLLQLSVFDQLDPKAALMIDTALRSAFNVFEPRVAISKQMKVDESADEKAFIIIVPYAIKVNGINSATRLVVNRPTGGNP